MSDEEHEEGFTYTELLQAEAMRRRLRGEPPPNHNHLQHKSPRSHSHNHVCWDCRIVNRHGYKCPRCHGVMEVLYYRARVPKKKASDRVWEEFRKRFSMRED